MTWGPFLGAREGRPLLAQSGHCPMTAFDPVDISPFPFSKAQVSAEKEFI